MAITRMTNEDMEFYVTLGPYLSRRDIVAELGAPVWDEDGKQWFVASTRGALAGFVALCPTGDDWHLASFWVLPDERGKGHGMALLGRAVEHARSHRIDTMAAPAAVDLFKRAGFSSRGKRGQYTKMVYP